MPKKMNNKLVTEELEVLRLEEEKYDNFSLEDDGNLDDELESETSSIEKHLITTTM